MNKQEAIKELRRQSTQVYDQRAVELEQAIHIVSQTDEPQKVVVPKFVAEWIDICKEHLAIGLFSGMSPTCLAYHNQADELINWLKSIKNQEIFAKAWIYGYKIKEEKLYIVQIPNPNDKVFKYTVLGKGLDGCVFITKVDNAGWKHNHHYQLTEKEIKKDFEWAWQFAKPVGVE